MARPREFDPKSVLRDAGQWFELRGYRATSIQDISLATGVKPGSLYKAFGDKRALFLKCAEDFMASRSHKQMLIADLDVPVRESFRRLFEAIVDSADSGRNRGEETAAGKANGAGPANGGCLVTSTAYELAPLEPKIYEALAVHLEQTERVVRQRLLWAKEREELAPEQDVEALTAFLMTVIRGLLMNARVAPDREAMRLASEVALKAFDRPPE